MNAQTFALHSITAHCVRTKFYDDESDDSASTPKCSDEGSMVSSSAFSNPSNIGETLFSFVACRFNANNRSYRVRSLRLSRINHHKIFQFSILVLSRSQCCLIRYHALSTNRHLSHDESRYFQQRCDHSHHHPPFCEFVMPGCRRRSNYCSLRQCFTLLKSILEFKFFQRKRVKLLADEVIFAEREVNSD